MSGETLHVRNVGTGLAGLVLLAGALAVAGLLAWLALLSDAPVVLRVFAVLVAVLVALAAVRGFLRAPWSMTADADGLTLAYPFGLLARRWDEVEAVHVGVEMIFTGLVTLFILPLPVPMPWDRLEQGAARFVFRDGRSAKVYLGKVDRVRLDDLLLDVDVAVTDAGRMWISRL